MLVGVRIALWRIETHSEVFKGLSLNMPWTISLGLNSNSLSCSLKKHCWRLANLAGKRFFPHLVAVGLARAAHGAVYLGADAIDVALIGAEFRRGIGIGQRRIKPVFGEVDLGTPHVGPA